MITISSQRVSITLIIADNDLISEGILVSMCIATLAIGLYTFLLHVKPG